MAAIDCFLAKRLRGFLGGSLVFSVSIVVSRPQSESSESLSSSCRGCVIKVSLLLLAVSTVVSLTVVERGLLLSSDGLEEIRETLAASAEDKDVLISF